MLAGLWNKGASEPPPELGNDASANELLDCVVHELVDGRSRNEITKELIRNRWERPAANQFTQLAQQIARELLKAPDQRAVCARKGLERIQAAWGWIGSGVVMGIFLTSFVGPAMRRYNRWVLLPIAYGVVELISGYTLWYPHRDFWTPEDASKAKGDAAGKKPA